MTDDWVWVRVEKGEIPKNAICGGFDTSGNHQYVAKGNLEGDWIPGKYVPTLNENVYVAWNGSEHEVSDFEVLTLNNTREYEAKWEDYDSKKKGLPTDAFKVGYTNDGDTLYVGRKHIYDSCHIGKVSLNLTTCFIPYEGEEKSYTEDFQLLFFREIHDKMTSQREKEIETNVIDDIEFITAVFS